MKRLNRDCENRSLFSPTRMPLYAQHVPVGARIFQGFNQTIGCPRRSRQIAAYIFDGLMMMAVYEGTIAACQTSQRTAGDHPHPMRRSVARYSLRVF